MAHHFTPSEVGQYIKGSMERDPILKNIAVDGEIFGYKFHSPSGNHYFSLKDEQGVVQCVMYKQDAARLLFQPENGLQVTAVGRVTVYPRDGRYQLYCRRLAPLGFGNLHTQFEELKQKLHDEGLFDECHKKKLPFLPRRVALLTSPSGAVVHDMLRVLRPRCPITSVFLVPVTVQGQGAAVEIASAIRWVNRHALADVMIVGRGGGSQEDLWAFNEEVLAREIFYSTIPIISAVGHEPDVSISDYVADARASTPTYAAKMVVPDWEEIAHFLAQSHHSLLQGLKQGMDTRRQSLQYLQQHPIFQDPYEMIREKSQCLDYMSQQLLSQFQLLLEGQRRSLGEAAASLQALSPLDVLGRGYALAQDDKGSLLHSVSQTTKGDRVTVQLIDGTLSCEVQDVQPEQKPTQ